MLRRFFKLGFYKKTVLLSNQGDCNNGMAILTIEKNNGGVFGSLKVFDIQNFNNLMLGISVDGVQAYKNYVSFSGGNVFNFKLESSFNINGKIGCVIVDKSGDKVKVLLWGTNGSFQYKQDIINTFQKDVEIKVDVAAIEVKNIEDCVAKDVNDETFNPELFESTEEEIEEIVEENLGGDFYNLIHEQIDELFSRFPIDENLQRMIPNSKWVKINYEDDGKVYVLGLIFDQAKIKYISYGIPGTSEKLPPEELQNYSQWLPIDSENIHGYWLMYQDADSGESVVFNDVKLS